METKYLTQLDFDRILISITGENQDNGDGTFIFTPKDLEPFKVIITN